MEPASEDKLVEASRGGDRTAYADLVRLHARRVYAVCLAMTGSAADAEDLAQEALLRGLAEIGSLRSSDRFGPWIGRIAGNLSRDLLRKRSRERPIAEAVSEGERGDPDRYADLRRMLLKLPDRHRIPLLLYYFDGRSSESVAKALGISNAGALTRLSRARRELRKLLENGDDER